MLEQTAAWEAARRSRGDQAALVFAVILTVAMFTSQIFHLLRSVGTTSFTTGRFTELITIGAEVVIFFVAIGGWLFFIKRIRETRRRLIEEESLRISAQAELAEAQKMEALGQMAAGVAHDFGNQMAVINGSLDLMSHDADRGRPSPAHLRRARTAAEQASETVRSLMLFGRRSAGRRVPVDLTDVVHTAGALAMAMLPSNINLEFSQADSPLWTEGDQTQLTQVLMNLILNARDAMPDGGTITLETGCVGEARSTACPKVWVSVTDDGTGMPPDVAERVFEPFFTTRAGLGTGLGLSVVHGIVTAMGGSVSVDSTPGSGSRFVVEVPTAVGRLCREQAPPAPRPEHEPVMVDLGDSYRTSLVVEALVQSGIGAMAAAGDATSDPMAARAVVIQAGNGSDASTYVTASPDRLIIIDPSSDADLPAGTRTLNSPVPVSSLIAEVASAIAEEARP
jgi:signal transduction histidine kinase